MDLRLSILLFIFGLLLFGCTANTNPPQTMPTSQIEKNATPPVKTYECHNGNVVTDLALCPKCPSSCDDNNSCTADSCNASTNYSCSHASLDNMTCGTNGICTNGICNELAIVNTTNKTPSIKEPEIRHLANESKQFIALVNEKRMANYPGNVALQENIALDFIAKKCGEEMLKNGESDINVCYEKYGSFTDLLARFGFYGTHFIYASESETAGENLTSKLFDNMTANEKNLLTNLSINRPDREYPVHFESIGNSIVCDSKKCIQTTLSASNMFNERNYYNNYWAYRYDLIPPVNGTFVPRQFTLKVLDPSESTPAWCELYIYENLSIIQADSNYWWSDYWDFASWGHTYKKKIAWTDYYSEKITTPTIVYAYCYSLKTPKVDINGREVRDKFEIKIEYLPENLTTDNTSMEKIIVETLEKRKTGTSEDNLTLLELINNRRESVGYAPLKENKALSTLTQNCVEMSMKRDMTYDSCYYRVFGNSSSPFWYALATRGIFGRASSTFNRLPDSNFSNSNLIGYEESEYLWGDSAKDLEFFGSGKTCSGGVCTEMVILGGNLERTEFTNVKKDCGWADITCSYGYTLLRWLKMSRGIKFDQDMYPNITIKFNSTVPAEYFFYSGIEERLWENGLPINGWDYRTGPDTKKKYYEKNLSGNIWNVVYAPEIKSVEAKENVTTYIAYTPNKIQIKN